MKLLFCLKYFLPEQVAGTEIYVAALCKELQHLGSDVVIVKPGYGIDEVQQYFYEGLRVVEYPESKKVDKDLITGKRKPDGIGAYERVILNEKPDIIHFHEVSGSNGVTIEHLKIANRYDIPVFTTLHLPGYVCKTGMFRYKNKHSCDGVIEIQKCSVCVLHNRNLQLGTGEILTSVGYWAKTKNIDLTFLPKSLSGVLSYPTYIEQHASTLHEVFSLSRKVFVLSEWFRNVLLKNNQPEDKMVVLPKALPMLSLIEDEVPSVKGKEDGHIKLVYLGRICEIKGLHVVLEALNCVSATNWTLDIYGQVTEEVYYDRCKNLSKKFQDKIYWRGIVEPGAVVNTLKNYDALIFPTIIEEMVGLVVQEAFAAGIPVIGSDVSGIAEQVQHGINGLLFKSGNTASLYQLLNKVMNDNTTLPHLSSNVNKPLPFNVVAAQSLAVYISVVER